MYPYRIDIESSFKEFWRYNVVITGVITHKGKRVTFISHSDDIAPIGSKLTAPPAGCEPNRKIHLSTAYGDSITLYIYIVPHTIPSTNRVADTPPFDCTISISQEECPMFSRTYKINQWSGENIVIKL